MFLIEYKSGARTLVPSYPSDLSGVLFVAPFLECDSLEHFWAQSVIEELDAIKTQNRTDYVDRAMELLTTCAVNAKVFWEEYQYEDPERELNESVFPDTTDRDIVADFLVWGHVDRLAANALFNFGVDAIAEAYLKRREDLEYELTDFPELLSLCKERQDRIQL